MSHIEPRRATPFPLRALTCLALSAAFLTCLGARAAETALTNWMVAQAAFQQAGTLVGQKKFDEAKKSLESSAKQLAPAYSSLATKIVTQISAMEKEEDAQSRGEQAARAAAALQSYDAAVSLWPTNKAATPDDDDDDELPAWYLFEAGKVKEALAAYEGKLKREQIAAYQEYYRKQIELLQSRATNGTNMAFALEFAKEHYLKGLEEKADAFGALRELNRVLPQATNSQSGVHIYQQIIDCLSALNDDSGREAWENKLLADFKINSEACATVFFDRGIRAYHAKRDLDGSLALFRKVMKEFPETKIWGDAQYSAGLILQEQGKFDEAIATFGAIFPSHVNDYDLNPGSSDDYKNYRFKSALRTSECYASKKDYKKAIEFAEMARDRYIVASYCKTCLHEAKASVDQRIANLKIKAAEAKP